MPSAAKTKSVGAILTYKGLAEEGDTQNGDDRHAIIDGQQRMITFVLLLRASYFGPDDMNKICQPEAETSF